MADKNYHNIDDKAQVEVMRLLRIAFDRAEHYKIKIVVASDEEGNSWNGFNSESLFYGQTKKDFVALGVWGHEDEDNIFEIDDK